MVRTLFKALVMPPLSLFLLGGLGFLLRKKRPVLGRTLMVSAVAALVLLSLPVVAAALMQSVQHSGSLDLSNLPEGPRAIVVLAADFQSSAPEYGGSTVGMLSLERLRYAARLARATGLPVLASGGPPRPGERPLAEYMREVLVEDLSVEVRWVETRSRNTRQNLRRSAEMLLPEGIESIFLVTHAWHMPRAAAAAEAAGFQVVRAPTCSNGWPPGRVGGHLPSARALRESTWALHEWIGRAWYAVTG